MFVVTRRATLLIPSGPEHDLNRQHLFVCLNDPHGPPKQVLLATICSVPPSGTCDTTTLLNAGDHEFIKHQSFVAYGKTRLLEEASLVRGVANGVFHDRGLLDEAVFDRVVGGLYRSDWTKPFATEFLDATLGRKR